LHGSKLGKFKNEKSICRESYEDAWYQLDEREQAEAVNEHIIMPEVVLRNPEPPRPEFVSFPRLRFVSPSPSFI
jgi:hypothetical protein